MLRAQYLKTAGDAIWQQSLITAVRQYGGLYWRLLGFFTSYRQKRDFYLSHPIVHPQIWQSYSSNFRTMLRFRGRIILY